jgi:hypothetical protein
MGDAIEHLSVWATHIVEKNLTFLGFAERRDAPLLPYCNAAG